MTEHQRRGRPERIGRYKVIDRIGKGAMGVVYSAHDEAMGRDVAIKVMMTDYEDEPDIRARFVREAQISAKLAHRNIVTVFDIGEDNGRLYIVMELLRGLPLGECLKQRTLAIEEKIDIIMQVCEGLAVANAEGVQHRDVKPGNLFVQNDGSVKILDFGIARLASSNMTATGARPGTPDYMSPEQVEGVPIDERSDIFSVGVVLYLMLSGQKPFAAPDVAAVLNKVLHAEPPPLSAADAPPALTRIVAKVLAKDREQRFQRFPEFSAELGRWRRRFDAETRTLAGDAARRMEQVLDLATQEGQACQALGIAAESDAAGWTSEIGADYPALLESGPEALRAGAWRRADVEAIAARLESIDLKWTARVALLRAAEEDVQAAHPLLESGDARGAMARLDSALQRLPAAAVEPLLERARSALAAQQALDDRVASLVTQAADANAASRFETALSLLDEALRLQPQHPAARDLAVQVKRAMEADEADRQRRCERSLERVRRALELEQFDEAERQLQLAGQCGVSAPDVAAAAFALNEARTARDTADALVQEIAGELALARSEFQAGRRQAAVARLQALVARHPDSSAAQTELARLQAEDQRLRSAEGKQAEADRLAAEASAALSAGDAQAAHQLSNEALVLIPSHEAALRTSALSLAHSREASERAARLARAERYLENARSCLERGNFDRCVKEARRAAELDPTGSAAPALIAEAFRRQAAAAAEKLRQKEAAQQAAELRVALAEAERALRAKAFVRARVLAERAVAIDPEAAAPRELLVRIAAASALAATQLEEKTVDLNTGRVDPDATAVLSGVRGTRIVAQLDTVLRVCHHYVMTAVDWARRRWAVQSARIARAAAASAVRRHKEP